MKVRYLLIAVAVLFTVTMIANQSHAAIDPKTILASWNFDEGSGTVAKDSSGNGNDIKITGAKWVDGMVKPGKALDFDGVGNYVFGGVKGAVPATISLEAWIYPAAGGVVIAELGQDGAINSGWHDSQMEVSAAGDILVGCWIGSELKVPLGTYKFGTWYYVVMTYDKTNVKGYVNGELKKTQAAVKQWPGGLWYNIGGQDTTALAEGKFFKGMVDRVAVYNVALSDADVLGNFSLTAVLPASKLTTTWGDVKR